MAPARRKRGMSAAAAAAAAAAQWKLGDLVLAKMKGFPAWPAMISEPEQWGLASVKNKRLVYFYGTKQIAFCNYAELEAFTEEKRRSLLAKRHGKGADFVRAVDEIIDVYDSLKEDSNNKLDLTANEVKPGEENLGDNNSTLDTKGQVKSSNMGSDKKLEDHSVSVTGRNFINADEPSVISTGSARCVVNSAPDGPTENISMLDEMRNIPLSASSFSKKKLRDAHPQNCYTRSKAPALRRSRSSLGIGIRKAQDSCKLSGETSLASVNLVPDDNKEDCTLHKYAEYGKANSGSPSMLEDVCLHSSGDTFNQPGTPGASDSNKNLSSTAKVDNTCDSEASQNGASATEFTSNSASSLPMKSTVIFKRKRKPDRNWVPHTADCVTPNKDKELQDELSGSFGDSPNSKNELNKSDGDEHLPLVKRARVRMGRPQSEAAPGTVEHIDVPSNRSGIAAPADHSVMHISNAFSADQSSVVNSVPNLSSILDMPLPSEEGHSVWKNKEYQPRVLTLDVEAALPPSKRLHRALEAMSANVAETISSLPEEVGSKQLIVNGCVSSENSHSNKSADTVVTTPDRSGIIEGLRSPGMQFMHSSTVKKHTSGSILQNNNVVVSMKLNEAALDVTQAIAMPDRLSSSSVKPCNDVSKLISCNSDTKPLSCPTFGVNSSYDRCGEPVDQQKLLSDNNVSSDSVPHGETVLASATNLGDTTSSSSLATKSSSIQSDADTRTFEVHTSALALKELNHRNLKDKCTSPDSMPMKELIAVAQARRFSRSTSFSDNFLISKYIAKTSVNTPLKEGQGKLSPSNRIIRPTSTSDSIHSKSPFDSLQQNNVKTIAGSNEANAARKAFEVFLGTLTRTKENIARATRLAIECAKHGIAGEAIDIIVERMEKETNLYKRVDLFFLIDSITQCSRNQKGGAGDLYPSLIQAVLPRLLYAAAPPGNSAWENRRQCLKVLKLWLERRTLPEYIIRHHIRELEVINEASFGSSRRPSRTERALNDPLRDNEGMLVDEYGSNAGFHIPNLICTKVLEDDEGSSSEDRSFEAVTPEQDAPGGDEKEESQMPAEKHRLILEEVDGELEMEDVSPPSEAGASTLCQPDQSDTDHTTSYHHPSDTGPPLPNDGPPLPPPLPCSPPPVPPPPPVPIAQSTQMQATLQMVSDPVGPHPPIATYNIQSQQSHPIVEHPSSMNPSVAPLQPTFCNSAHAVRQNQIAPLNPPGPRSNFPTPPTPYHGNNYRQHPTASTPNGVYHLQRPPPPPPPNQFPHIPSEPHQRPQQWSYQYNGHDRDHHRHDSMHHGQDRRPHFNDRRYRHDDRGHHFDERAIRGQMHHDADRGRFPPLPPGPPGPPDHFEASAAPVHYGRPSDPPPGPCSGWSMEPPVPHVAGAHGSWRPR